MASSVKVKVPRFDSVNKPYSLYMQEIEFWKVVSKVDKKEQAVLLAYDLPENDSSGIRDKLFNELSIDQLHCDDGVKNFTEYMDKLFKKDDQTQAYEDYINFDNFKKSKDQKMQDFLNEFDKLYNIAAKRDMKLPSTVLAYKLLDAAHLSQQDRMFVLTGVDYSKKDTLYQQTKDALKKFVGEHVRVDSPVETGIKVEPTYTVSQLKEPTVEVAEALAAMGFYQKKDKGSYGGQFRGKNRYQRGGSGGRMQKKVQKIQKPLNSTNDHGDPLTCVSCGSYRHMLDSCPHSYENLRKNTKQMFHGCP